MKKFLIFMVLTNFLISSVFAASTKATITCDFPELKEKTILSLDLETKKVKQLNNETYDDFRIIGEMEIISYTTIYGETLKYFGEISTTGSGQQVIWDAQIVLMGGNQDDSMFTLVIAYREDGSAKATLISYWDGLDGGTEVDYSNECQIRI